MEHREPPPIRAGDSRPRSVAPDESDRFPFPPLGLPRPARVGSDRRRMAIGAALLLAAITGLSLAYLAARAARSWLADQPSYQIPFRDIVLDPPPPSWYRGGSAGFLEDVRRLAGMPESIPVLGLKEDELKRAFEASSPWVEEVTRIVYRPLGLAVHLVYKRPVALVVTSSKRPYLVDASAVILPSEDVDEELFRFAENRGLIKINGVGLADPKDPRAGIPWQPRPGAADLAPGNGRIPAAARLAGFLLERMQSIDRGHEPALNIRYINPMDSESRGLFLLNEEGASILWGQAPGEEPPASPTAEEKWEMLVKWSRQGKNQPIPTEDYWEIKSTEVVHQIFQKPPAPGSARTAPIRLDGETIPAKATGQSPRSLSH